MKKPLPEIPNCRCGHTAQLYDNVHRDVDTTGYYVICHSRRKHHCWAGPMRKTEREAIVAWNKVMSPPIPRGEYVLATKYSDGSPHDHWCVGFYDSMLRGRHLVLDSDGKHVRAGGFRRVEKISHARGNFILGNTEKIGMADRSLWWWKRCKMEDN